MTKGPWKYKKAQGHHHVLFPNGEVLDVQNESDARLIALVPEIIHFLRYLEEVEYISCPYLAKKLHKYK